MARERHMSTPAPKEGISGVARRGPCMRGQERNEVACTYLELEVKGPRRPDTWFVEVAGWEIVGRGGAIFGGIAQDWKAKDEHRERGLSGYTGVRGINGGRKRKALQWVS